MPVEPTPQVNAVQYRPILQQRLLLHEEASLGHLPAQAERTILPPPCSMEVTILSLIKHVTLNYKAFLTCKFASRL